MENNFENQTPENSPESNVNTAPEETPVYRDPNEGAAYTEVKEEETGTEGPSAYNYGQQQNNPYPNEGYHQPYGNAGNYNCNPNYSGNMNYNGNMNYGAPQMDTTPLSMGEWLLTLLTAMIPCAGLILYFIWAFSKSGNLNRRNFCRAYLIVQALALVLSFIFAIFIVAAVGAGTQLYY